jgi:hypothetical protein
MSQVGKYRVSRVSSDATGLHIANTFRLVIVNGNREVLHAYAGLSSHIIRNLNRNSLIPSGVFFFGAYAALWCSKGE